MILTHDKEQYKVLRRLFWPCMSSADELPIIHNFITNLENYINGRLPNEEEYFTIIGENSLNLSPLGITQEQLITFCKKIRSNQDNLHKTLSNYMIALGNTPLLDIINHTGETNAFFISGMYMLDPLHLDILANDLEELSYAPRTPDNIMALITNPHGVYYNFLNLDSDKEESDSYLSEEDYNYSDL